MGTAPNACGTAGQRCVACGLSSCQLGFCTSTPQPGDGGSQLDAGNPASDAGNSGSDGGADAGLTTDAGTGVDGGSDAGSGACDGGTLAICNGQCVDTASDVDNCGGCDQRCYGAEGTLSCNNGVCAIVCNPGYAACDPTFASCDYSVNNSPDTCGNCQTQCPTGQACLNGTCETPAGTPAVVYQASDAISELAVDATHLYWFDLGPNPTTSQGSVMALTKGGTTPTALATGLASPQFLRQDATRLYWIDMTADAMNGSCPCVYAVAKGGGTPLLLGVSQSPTGLAVAGSNAYWTDFQCASLGNGGCGAPQGTLFAASITTGGAQAASSGLNEPGALASDGSTLYWADGYNQNIVALAAGTTGAPRVLIAGMAGELAVQGNTLYWTDLGGWLWSGPTAGGSGNKLIEGPYTSFGRTGLVVDASNVYWWDVSDASFADDVVMRVAPDGTGFNPMVASQIVSGGAVDPTTFYWVDGASARILSLPR